MEHFAADRMLAEAWWKVDPKTEDDIVAYYTKMNEFSLFHLRF